MITSEKTDQISAALAPALSRLRNPKPDAKGQVRGRTDYTYVSLANLAQHVRDVFKDVGLGVTQETLTIAGQIGVLTRIIHLSGQWIEYGPLMFRVDGNAQDAGSALTYLRRYSLAAAVGVAADEDDDAATVKAPASTQARGAGNERAGADQATPARSQSSGGDHRGGAVPEGEGTGAEAAGEGVEAPVSLDEAVAAYGGKAHLLRAARLQWDVRSIADLSDAMLTELIRAAKAAV